LCFSFSESVHRVYFRRTKPKELNIHELNSHEETVNSFPTISCSKTYLLQDTNVVNEKNSDVDCKADAFQRREYYKIEQGRAVAELIFSFSSLANF